MEMKANMVPFLPPPNFGKTVSSTKGNVMTVSVSIAKPGLVKIFYSVNIFRILREKWKKIFAIGFIVIYITNKLMNYFSQNGIIELF